MKIAKRILSVFLAVTVVFSYCSFFANNKITAEAATLTGDSNYLFAYFTGTSIEGQTIHLAVSQDGLNYTALRNNDPVIVPSKGTGCVRDPYLWYNENDGYYYILATDLDFTDTGSDYSDNSESFIVWRSKDLVNWYDETMIDVKAILGRLGINNNNMQAVWAPQVLWDGSEFVVYFSLQCDGTSNGSWNPLTIVYLKTSNLLDESKYDEYGVIHNPGRHVIDADIIKKPGTNQYYMFYKDESASGGIQSIYYMISDNGPTGPYYAPDNANEGRGPQLFADIGQNLEGCNSFFDDNGNLLTFVDEYGYWNSLTNQNEAHFHVSRSSDFSTFTTLPDSSHNINSLSPRHGSVVKITDEEYNRLLAYSSEITSSSFPETEKLSDHLVGRYFTTADYTYNAANGKNDLTLKDGTISTATDSDGDYYAYFNAAGAEINLANLILGDLNLKDGFTITFSASAPSSLGSNSRFFDISNNWSQRADSSECYLHMSPVAESNGLYVGAFNGPVTTTAWTWASQGKNYNDGIMHEYIISFADGNMILYIDGKVAMKRDRYNMCAEYGDNFLTDNWIKEIGNSIMRIGKSEWGADPLFTGSMQNLCIYDCSLSYYDVQKMQKQFDDQAGKTTIAKIAVPETVYMTPSTGESKTGQYYVNNRIHDGSNEVSLEVNPAQTKGVVEFYIPGAKSFTVQVSTVTSGIGDIVYAEAGATSGSRENTTYSPAANGYYSYTSAGLYISGTGMKPGTTALAEWKITVTMQDNSKVIYYAYSTLYAPYLNPVGVAIYVKSYRSGLSTLFGSSMAWVSGVHGFTNDPAANYYAKTSDKSMVPLLGAIGTGDNENGPDNWISSSSGGNTLSTASFRYVAVNGNSSDFGAIGVYRSPVANLTIDTSRYTNFNQIPNLTVGFNFTDKENAKEQHWYVSDYTSGNMSYFKDYQYIDSRNNVNSQAGHYYNEDSATPNNVISNNGLVNANVSTGAEHNAPWDRVVLAGTSNKYIFKGAAYTYGEHATKKGVAYSVNYVQINGTNVDKTQLRNLVLKATYFEESNYTTTSWNNYKTALQNAALALGNPANADVDSYETALQNAMDALQTTITLAANGGTINGAATTEYNVTIGTETSVTSDLSAYVPVRDGYRFNGWATSADAKTGAMTVTTGFMPTLYAVWVKIQRYTVAYDANGGSGSHASVTVELGKSVTLPSSGFTKVDHSLIGWSKDASATTADYRPGQTVSGLTDTSDVTVTLYAIWAENKYTVVFDANGGSGSIASISVRISETFTLPSSGFTKDGFTLNGWATNASATTADYQLGQSVTRLAATGEITLYAVWTLGIINVTFDNLIDFSAWNKVAGSGVVSDVTDTGFTITCNEGSGEATSSSPYFPVEPGKNYMIDIDITDINSKGWDVYIFFCDANGTWVDFADGETNRYSATTRWDHVFTAPNKDSVVKAQIRVDANNAGGKVNFDNIRVYEYDGKNIDVDPVNKIVEPGKTFGPLPTPTKKGYTFVGWYDGDTLITESSTVTQTSTVYLKSKWVIGDTSLTSDNIVIDFATPIEITPLTNDTIFNSETGTKKLVGLSTDGINYASSLNGTYGSFTLNGNSVTYTPGDKVVNGTESVYYHASLTTDGITTVVKSKLTVAPASNVLYEEDIFTVAAVGAADWSATGTAANAAQDASGTSGEIYGFDSGYNKIQAYSGGNALKTTVSNDKKTSKFASFAFTGSGFELNGTCGADTGILIVSVKNNKTGEMVKSYIVDTYYGDAKYGTLNQVPLISETGLDQGNYTVQIASSFLSISGALKASQKMEGQSVGEVTANVASGYDDPVLREALAEVGLEYVLDTENVDVIWFDENSTFVGGLGANTPVEGQLEAAALTSLNNVIDSVRVYNPIVDGDLYYISTEKNASYINVMDNLLSKNALDRNNFFAYVSGKDKESIDIEAYETIGSKDELYLAKSTEAVAFTIKNFDKANGGRVMISLRAAYGNSVVVKICNTKEITLTSNTEMYYDITDYIGNDGLVTIQNMSDGTLLSVGSLKITDPTSMVAASISADFDIMLVRAMLNSPVIEEEVDPEIPDDNDEPVIPDDNDDPTDTDKPTDTDGTDTPDEPENNEDPTEEPTDPEEPATDDTGCPFIWLLKWIVETFRKLFSAIMDLIGF